RLNSGAQGTYTLGQEDYVTLPFTLAEPVVFNIGDWADLSSLDESLGGHFRDKYVVTEQPEPSWSNTTGGHEYKLRLDAYYMAWRHKIFKYLPEDGAAEASWSLTATLDAHLGVFLGNLRALGYTYGQGADGAEGEQYTYSIDGTVEEEARLVEYENTSLVDALTAMAQTWDCDWWVAEKVIYFGRCEQGNTVNIEIGRQAQSMDRSESSGTYCNRLYAFGSDRNVPLTYRRSLLFEVTARDGTRIQDEARRLQSSYFGEEYKDGMKTVKSSASSSKAFDLTARQTHQLVNAVNTSVEGQSQYTFSSIENVFDMTRSIENTLRSSFSISQDSRLEWEDGYGEGEEMPVEDDDGNETGEYQTFYRVKLAFTDYDGNAADAFTFSKDYRISGTDLGVVFKSGLMNGMDFLVNFNPEGLAEDKDDAQQFEIIASDDYGRTLPDNLIYPQKGDRLVLYGWDCTSLKATEGLVANAEQELYDYAVEYIQKLMYDDGTYTVKLYPAWVNADPAARTLSVGQSVNLINRALFPDGRLSRVIGYQLQLDIPLDTPTYTIGESTQYSRLGELEGKLDGITYRGTAYYSAGTAGDGTSVYLIKTNDSTAASDSNAYSALRAQSVFLRKDRTDTMPYPLTLGDTLSVTGDTDMAGKLTVADLATFSKVYAQQMGDGSFLDGFFGYGWQLFQDTEGDWNLTLDRLTVRKAMNVYELVIQKIRSVGGQLVVSAANGEIADVMTTQDGGQYVLAFKDVCEFSEGDLIRCQKFTGTSTKYYWVEVSKVESGAVYVDVSEFGGVEPEVGDEVVLMGNTTNTLRQNFISISATEDGKPRIEVHNGVSTKNFSTDADGEYPTLRAMFGNLDGITDSYFPSDNQPQGDGLYADNAFLRGRFVLKSTGNDIETQLSVTEEGLRLSVTEAVAILGNAVSKTSYLANGYFGDGLEHWTWNNWGSQVPYLTEGLPLVLNKRQSYLGFLFEGESHGQQHLPYLTIDGTRTVLYMRGDCQICQKNKDFETLPDTFDTDADGLPIARLMRLTLYAKSLGGTVEAGASLGIGASFSATDAAGFDYLGGSGTFALTADGDITEDAYTRISGTARWDGTGDFSLHVGGHDYYVYGLTLEDVTDDTGEAMKAVYSELSVQAGSISSLTSSYTTLSGSLEDAQAELEKMDNALTSLTESLTADINTAIGEYIQTTAFSESVANLSAITEITRSVDAITNLVSELEKYADEDTGAYSFSRWVSSADFTTLIQGWVTDGHAEASGLVTASSFASLYSTAATEAGMTKEALAATFVTKYDGDDGQTYLESGVLLQADQILLDGYTVINDFFRVDDDGVIHADKGGYIGCFAIDTENSNRPTASSSYYTMSLHSQMIQFTSKEGVTAYFGSNTANYFATSFTNPLSITIADSYSGQFHSNIGMYLNVTGAVDTYNNKTYIQGGNHALLIEKGDICGFRLKGRCITADETLDPLDSVVMVAGSGTVKVTLPSSPESGQVYIIVNLNDCTTNVYSGGSAGINYTSGKTNTSGGYAMLTTGMLILIYSENPGEKVWVARELSNATIGS
ncbi:MAG: hypothetical protein LUC33_02780, partial [Prevotellaceae bacterium]|nr:hypothetical protein [Prevotellaceae bacterium]